MPTVPDAAAWTVSMFALAGTFYGAVKALAQSRARLLLSYSSLSFYSMLWWFAASTGAMTPRAAVFVGAVGFTTSGLLLAWQVIRTRYGDDVDPRSISGLAATMPRYAVLLSLLVLAATGLPPFGLFASFMGLLLLSEVSFSIAIVIIVTAWLAASWYIMGMAQQWLFGTHRHELRYNDLLPGELASLTILVVVLLALGVVPTHLFETGTLTTASGAITDLFVWDKQRTDPIEKRGEWSCEGLSISQAKLSRSIGRCGLSCTIIRSIVLNTFRLRSTGGAASTSCE